MGKSTRGLSISLTLVGIVSIVIMIVALLLGVMVYTMVITEAQNEIDYYESHPIERTTYQLTHDGDDPVEVYQQQIDDANILVPIFGGIAVAFLILAIMEFIAARRARDKKSYGYVFVVCILNLLLCLGFATVYISEAPPAAIVPLLIGLVPLILVITSKPAFGEQPSEPVPDASKDEVKDKLERLKAMKDDGLLTDDEYNEKKKQILDEI